MNDTRDSKGKFTQGSPGGPGRPKRNTERAYLDIIQTACPPETWREVVDKAVNDAKNGDPKAREWLASYLVGKPEQVAPTLRQLAIDERAGADADGITDLDLLEARLIK